MNWRIFGFIFYFCGAFAWATGNVDELLAQSKTQLQQGHYSLALDSLQTLPSDVTAEQKALADGMTGLIYYQKHQYGQAAIFLKNALRYETGLVHERVNWLIALADVALQDAQDKAQAQALYAKAEQLAANDSAALLTVRLAQAHLQDNATRAQTLQNINTQLNTAQLNDNQRAQLLIKLGAQAMTLDNTALAYSSFEQAKRPAQTSPRLLTEAIGNLAQLYENQQRFADAITLNEQALQTAQSLNAHDLLLDLAWRQGRLQHALKHDELAITAYQQAVEHIEAIRFDIPVAYENGYSSFRRTLAPIYLELADLLLQQAATQHGEQKNTLLRRARDTVELIKQSEMEDFLASRCAVQSSKAAALEQVAAGTAVIYPIIFADRLELIVSAGNDIAQFTQTVSNKSILYATRTLASYLRNGNTNTTHLSQKLYQWLIAPENTWLQAHQIKTLVIVPDSILRLIPLAALHDGQQYLIEKYAVVTSSGLTLFAPTSLSQRGFKTLLAGISEPGSVIDHLPSEFLQNMSSTIEHNNRNRRESRSLLLGDIAPNLTKRGDELLRDAVFRAQLKTTLSLPGVHHEMDALQQKMPNALLMNEQFTLNAFKEHVGTTPYSMIHIASHGVFGGSANSSFIMAYDDIVDMNQLEGILKAENFKQNPLELLTLSACQTAEGDDRAPLGLSGIAIKAKVKSALGSLWSVNDEATYKLMSAFYTALLQGNTNKAQALQQAQLTLLKDKQFAHPFFWSPFILVGNWL